MALIVSVTTHALERPDVTIAAGTLTTS